MKQFVYSTTTICMALLYINYLNADIEICAQEMQQAIQTITQKAPPSLPVQELTELLDSEEYSDLVSNPATLPHIIEAALNILEENQTLFTPESIKELTEVLEKIFLIYKTGNPATTVTNTLFQINSDGGVTGNLILPTTSATVGQIQQPSGTRLLLSLIHI